MLNRYFPGGTPSGFLVALQCTYQPLIEEIGKMEGTVKELHDGVSRIADKAAQRWVDGFNECEQKVRARAAEVGLAPEQIEALLPA